MAERELKRQWYKTKSSHMLFLRASRSSTVGNLYQAGWRLFLCTYCSLYCFVAEWHIHSQAGLEMNAGYSTTWLFGGFQVFFFSSSFFNASLSQYNTIHTYDSKVEYLQTGFIWRGRHIRKENSSKFWILPERKQSQPVRSKMYAGSKSSPQFIVIFTGQITSCSNNTTLNGDSVFYSIEVPAKHETRALQSHSWLIFIQ